MSQNERTAHFGLGGSTEPVDLVTIEWTSGIVQHLYDVTVDQTLLVIEAEPTIPGDYNHDGTVDAADYVVWRDNEGTNNPLPNDPIGGTIGPAQFDQWRASFGQTAGNGAGADVNAPVPEPTSFVLMALATGWWLRRGRAGKKVPATHQRVTLVNKPPIVDNTLAKMLVGRRASNWEFRKFRCSLGPRASLPVVRLASFGKESGHTKLEMIRQCFKERFI